MNKVYVLITETYRNGKRVDHLVSVFAKQSDAANEWQSRCDNAMYDAKNQLDEKEISFGKDEGEYVFDVHKSCHREEWCVSHWIESHKVC